MRSAIERLSRCLGRGDRVWLRKSMASMMKAQRRVSFGERNENATNAHRNNCFGGGTSFCRTRFGIHPMACQQLHDQRNQMGLLRWWNSSCWDSPHYYRMAVIAALPGGDWAFKSRRQGADRHSVPAGARTSFCRCRAPVRMHTRRQPVGMRSHTYPNEIAGTSRSDVSDRWTCRTTRFDVLPQSLARPTVWSCYDQEQRHPAELLEKGAAR
jgi:hypothetical protein